MIKRIKVVMLLTFIMTALSGCSIFEKNIQYEAMKQHPDTGIVVDNYSTGGHPIQLHFQSPPERIVAVWQNSVETILALGAGDKIVAALGIPFTDCLRPEYREIYEKIPVKQFEILDTEHILMLEPDFILGWSSTFSDKTIRTTDFWQGRNINTYYAVNTMPGRKKRTIDDEYDYIMDIGTILDKKDKARQIVDGMKAQIGYINRVTEHRYHPRAIIMEQMRDNYTVYGANSLPGDILKHVNGELIQTGKNISYEEMIEVNPDVIFLVYSEFSYADADMITAEFLNKPALQDIKAVKNRRVYSLPLYAVYGSATRTYDGICMMAAGLYPDLFGGSK